MFRKSNLTIQSNVVRIVNLQEGTRERWLRDYIEQRVRLIGQIKQIYVRKHRKLNLVYAYVIFESNVDAEQTVGALDRIKHEDKEWDVALIGPLKRYTRYNAELRKRNEDESVEGAETEEQRNNRIRGLATRGHSPRRQLPGIEVLRERLRRLNFYK